MMSLTQLVALAKAGFDFVDVEMKLFIDADEGDMMPFAG